MANPGPAISNFANAVLDQQNALRLVAFAKGVNLSAAGDTPMNVVTPSLWSGYVVITCNSNSAVPNVAAATVGVYSAVSQGGTAVLTTAALTGQTTSVFVYNRAATSTNAALTTPNLYVNVGSTVAAVGGVNATTDVLVYGYDVQT